MSTIKHPVGPHSARVYWRRRMVLGIGLLVLLIVIVMVVVRPGSPSSEEVAAGTSTEAPVQADALPTDEPRAEEPAGPVEGGPCDPSRVLVEAVTDAETYGPEGIPQLSVTVTNTGPVSCTLNAGTASQVFTVRSGEETYWVSTDCQSERSDATVTLQPGVAISSSTPIAWPRERSSADTCDEAEREKVPGGGASYHLSASVGGIESASSRQFILE